EKLARSWSEGAGTRNVRIEELQDRPVVSAILAVLAGDSIQVSTGDEEFVTLLHEFQARCVRARAAEIETELSRALGEDDAETRPQVLADLERLRSYLERV